MPLTTRTAAAIAMLLIPGAAGAQEAFVGVVAHDVNTGIDAHPEEAGVDEELGLRTGPLVDVGRWGSLRLYALGSVNDSGGVDFASAGAAWRWPLWRRSYVQAAIGGAVQSGDAEPYQERIGHLDLGSRFLFQPELMVGVPLSRRWAAEVGYVHISNGGFSPQNPGMDDLGARLVYRWGGR
ncbi:MAG TPA: acyloxyacyl hydrolase [Caulobacteraceae bacterium]|jgi:hypothetical protein|nr:acyloxyacyl hydrolase [Caulobacteraceae bacterium]